MLPENQPPLIITAAPYGPTWIPSDFPEDIPVTWDQQVQKAIDCYEAGARGSCTSMSATRKPGRSQRISTSIAQIGRLREAVPDMVLQIGGSISFAPEGDQVAKWQSYDTRHMLADIDPKPDQVTVAVGSSLFRYHLDARRSMTSKAPTWTIQSVMWQYSQMVADATPEFYIEHLRRLRDNGINGLLRAGARSLARRSWNG